MKKCITCGAELENTDFFCSIGCAFKGIKNDAKKLQEAFELKDQEDAEDLEFAKQCAREKYEMQYFNNPSL
jgi:hypothetical protein